jgi:hypothetical protein
VILIGTQLQYSKKNLLRATRLEILEEEGWKKVNDM